jgi:phosphopantetheine--protein transferase-like protein
MIADALIEYLSTLLNRPVSAGERVNLSSAQRARLVGWLEASGHTVASGAVPAVLEVSQLERSLSAVAAMPELKLSSRFTPNRAMALPARGIGIDIQSVAELVKLEPTHDLKGDAELRAIFTLRELSYAESRGAAADTLAGIFAAKEAIRKADPAMLRLPLTDIEILPDEQGAPQFRGFAISISHSAGIAIAIAIAIPAETAGPQLKPASPATEMKNLPREEPHGRTSRASHVKLVIVTVLIGAGVAGIAWLRALWH